PLWIIVRIFLWSNEKWNSAPIVPAMQCIGHLAKLQWSGGCQSLLAITYRNLGMILLITVIASFAFCAGNAPPSVKSFCGSTTIKAASLLIPPCISSIEEWPYKRILINLRSMVPNELCQYFDAFALIFPVLAP